jgi:gliding motility-associated-like protein
MATPGLVSLFTRLRLRLGGLLLLLALPFFSRAQTTAPGQAFDLRIPPAGPTRELCIGQTYTIRNLTPNVPAGVVYAYDFDLRDGLGQAVPAPLTGSLTFTPSIPGRFRFTQIISNLSTGRNDTVSQAYTVYPVRRPRIRVQQCLRTVEVMLVDTGYANYRVVFGTAPAITGAQGASIFSPIQPATATTLRIVVTGSTGLSACVPIPFDTVVQLNVVPDPRIRRLDVLAPTNSRSVALRFDHLLAGATYLIEQSRFPTPSTAWTVIDTLRPVADTAGRTIRNTPITAHRYRLRQLNTLCVGRAPNPNITSNEAGAVPISVTASSNINRITWPAYPAAGRVLRWNVIRNGRRLIQLSPTATTISDLRISCQQTYCYEVVAVVALDPQNAVDTLAAASADSCVIGVRVRTNVPAPQLKASFDLTNNLILTVKLPAQEGASETQYTETLAGGSPTAIGTSVLPELTIVAPDTARIRGACYRATFTDSCGNRSAVSPSACPMLLRVRRSADRRQALLSWTPYVGITPTYMVFVLDDQTNAIIDSFAIAPNTPTTYADPIRTNTRQIRRYRVRAQLLGNASTNVYSNTADLTETQIVRMPNAFTPNGDNLNDTFGPVGRYELRESELTIFDRWGRLIFQTTEANQGWDGRPAGGGAVVPPGVFLYRFRGRDALGQEFTQRGTVTVIQ